MQTKTVLIVEDDEDIGDLMLLALAGETPYQAVLATSSLQALRWTKTHKPDLLILDYHLPDINGIALYDHIRAKQELLDVPVMMISANVPIQEVRKRGIVLLSKPFELDILLGNIEHLINTSIDIVNHNVNDVKHA